MAYQALYNKYRPKTFAEVVGQRAIVTTLQNEIRSNKVAHAYLFCGPRGTGKTTMARLFAKALNCAQGEGKQCNECESCKLINEGNHPGVIERDAASNSTVDSIRQLIDGVSFKPVFGKYKIYIIDEVHNLSDSAFNALLKTIEEPPSFVIFILATTDPQKVLPTILSRVQRFDFSKVTDDDLILNMKRVLDSESLSYDEDALKLIASLSDGGVRDSLSILDKVISYCAGKVTYADIQKMLGLMSADEQISFINSIADKKADFVLSSLKEKYANGLDIRRLQNDLINDYKDKLIFTMTKNEKLLTKLKKEDVEKIKASKEQCQDAIDALLKNVRDNKMADDHFTRLQLTLLELMREKVAPVVQFEQNQEKREEWAKPVEIIQTPVEKKEAKPVEEKEPSISYTAEDVLYLMNHYDNEMKSKIAALWPKLSDYLIGEKGYLVSVLKNTSPRLFSSSVLVVTSKLEQNIAKLRTLKAAQSLYELTSDVFSTAFHILPLSEKEFNDIVARWKKKEQVDKNEVEIFWGEKKKTSTDFFNEFNQ